MELSLRKQNSQQCPRCSRTWRSRLLVTFISLRAYKKYKEEQEPEEEESYPDKKQPDFNIEQEIAKLKESINTSDPSFDDIKRILKVLTNYIKSKTMHLNNKFKFERRKKFPHEKRFSNMADYFRYSSEGLTTLQTAIIELQKEQTELMATIGVNQASIAKFGPQLGPFMQELVFDSDIDVEEVKKSIKMKT